MEYERLKKEKQEAEEVRMSENILMKVELWWLWDFYRGKLSSAASKICYWPQTKTWGAILKFYDLATLVS